MPRRCQGRTCQAWIDDARPESGGTAMPITRPQPCPGAGEACTHEGNLAVWYDGLSVLRYRVLGPLEGLRPAEHRGRSHFADCPDAEEFRAKCPACGHKPHPGKVCRKAGPVTCRQVANARIRGRFPCGCQEGAGDGDG